MPKETSTDPQGGDRQKGRRLGFRMPHIYVILFCLSAAAAVATYIVPASEYARTPGPDGREVVDPDQYGSVESSPTGFLEFITAVPRGLVDAGEVVFLHLHHRRRLYGAAPRGNHRGSP